MAKDRRQLNQVWIHNPRPKEWYVFGRYGSGKNSFVKTLGFARTKRGAEKIYHKFV